MASRLLAIATATVTVIVLGVPAAGAAPLARTGPAHAGTYKPRPPEPLRSAKVHRNTARVPGGARSAGAVAHREAKSATEIVSDRTASSSTWRERNGAVTVREYAAPHFYRPAHASTWKPINTSLTNAGNKPGEWNAPATADTPAFGPASDSMGAETVSLSGSTVGFTPLGAQDPDAAPTVAGSTATWAHWWSHTTVADQVTNTGVTERISLASPAAPSAFRYFVKGAQLRSGDHDSVTLVSKGHRIGEIPAPTVIDDGGQPVPNDVSGATYQIHGSTLTVTISKIWLRNLPTANFPVVIDPNVGNTSGTATAYAYSSSGSTASEVAVGVKSGVTWDGDVNIPLPAAPAVKSGQQPWKLAEAAVGVSVFPSGMSVWNEASKPTSYATVGTGTKLNPDNVLAYGKSASLINDTQYTSGKSAWFGLTSSGTYTQIPTGDIFIGYQWEQQPNAPTVTAPTAGQVVNNPTPTITISNSTATDICGTASADANCDASISYDVKVSTSSTLGAGQTVADSGWFAGPTSFNGSNTVVGTPKWTVPAGSLQDGTTYFVSVQDDNIDPDPSDYGAGRFYGDTYTYIAPVAAAAPVKFQVKQRLGAGGPSATDTVGAAPGSTSTPAEGSPNPGTATASETVNLTTGNLALTVGTPEMTTLSGPAGVSLSYNSAQSATSGQAASGGSQYGLEGTYYLDSGAHTFPATSVGQRIDSTVNLHGSYGYSPIGGVPTNTYTAGKGFMVRWLGQIQFPAASSVPSGTTFQVGGTTTGGLRIFLNGSSTATYNNWSGTTTASGKPGFGTSAINPGATESIEIDDWDPNNETSLASQFMINELIPNNSPPHVSYVTPSTWLTANPNGLPPGWSMGTATADWTNASDLGNEVVLHSSNGTTAQFTAAGNGTFTPPPGDTDSLSNLGGQLTLASSDGYTYVFNSNGALTSMTSAVNDLKPDALSYQYGPINGATAAPIVLQSITDPVSGRSINLQYGSGCFGTSPAAMLCAVNFWDGTQTQFGYNSSNELNEVLNPGNNATLFAYNATNQISDIRDGLANDYIGAGLSGTSGCTNGTASTGCALDTAITYNAAGQVASVTQPAPQPAISTVRPSRTYTYSPSTTTPGAGSTKVTIAGFTGNAEIDYYDAQSRITQQTQTNGLSAHYVFDNQDRPIISLNTTGQQTSTVYDSDSNTTDTYGPAPAACFATGTSNPWPTNTSYSSPPAPILGYLPVASPKTATGCDTTVPHTSTNYDQGIDGLAASYYPNATFGGAATLHGTGTGIGSTTGAGCTGANGYTASTSLCASWPAGSAPGATDGNGNWSQRLTGNVTVPATGTYTFTGTSNQPLALMIDGNLIGANTEFSTSSAPGGTSSGFSASANLTAGTHTIEIDVAGNTGSTTAYSIGDSSPIALTSLDPDYQLATSSTDPDGDVSTFTYTAPGLGAEYKLPTSSTIGAGSATALTTTTGYEIPGSGYLRRTSSTLPAGNQTTYSYYAGTDGPLAAVCGVSSSTPQGGQIESETDPAPSTSDQPVEKQYVYDADGRQVGQRTGPANAISNLAWNCTTYDARNRLLAQSWAAVGAASSRSTAYTYGVGGNPLVTSATDPSGTVTSTVDLLGRAASYTDANGQTTTTTYNQAGQLTGTTGPGGTLSYTYNATTALPTTVSNAGQTLATAGYSTTTQLLTSVAYGDGTTGAFGYDPNGRPNSSVFTNTSSKAMVTGDQVSLSPAGRTTTELTDVGGNLTNPNPAGPSSTDFSYDAAGRLITAYSPGEYATYGYGTNPASDGCADTTAGLNTNRTQVTVTPSVGSSSTTDSCFNTADQLTSTISNAGTSNATPSTSYNYNGLGQQTQDNGTTLTYDSSGRLASTTTSAGATTTYSYDALDRVIARTSSGSTTYYFYDGFDDTPAATGTSGGPTQQLIRLPGGVMDTAPTAAPTGTGQTWSYSDLRGNFTLTTNNAGTPNATPAVYDPWGQLINSAPINNATGPNNLTTYGADGKVTDSTTGITIMGARAYNPAEARFTSPDPQPGGCANQYTYVFGDPLSQNDLSGDHSCNWRDAAGYIAGAAGLTLGAIALAGVAPEVLGAASVILGTAGAISDVKACVDGDHAACGGLILDGSSVALGGVGAAASEGSLAAGLGGSVSLSAGLGGLVDDTYSGGRNVLGCLGNIVDGIGHLATSGWHKIKSWF